MSWIADNYGSRRGLLRYLHYEANWRLRPGRLTVPPLVGVQRLVFVCKGNICRSAMAEAVARSVSFPACSYGLDTHFDKPANPDMVRAARQTGYDLESHQTTPFDDYENAAGDLVLAFEPQHLEVLKAGRGEDWAIGLLGAWASPSLAYIHDPYGGSERYFHRVALRIEDAVKQLVKGIRSQND